ncbi:MAG: hypothetical protein HY303_15760 [Candidatus Wallbacteria bacterium]|nr:hypothetical protein [Candidatus Wallbacteria bacterium]
MHTHALHSHDSAASSARAPSPRRSALAALLLISLLLGTASPALALGGRPRGMGGAFIAISDDENAVFTNPAGLSQIDKSMVQVGANVAFRDDFRTDHFAYAGKIYENTGKEKLTLEDYLEADYELKTKPEKVANYSWGLGVLKEERSLKLNAERGFVLFYKANPRLNVGLVLGSVISARTGSTLGTRSNSFVTNLGGAYTLGAKRETIFAVDVMNIFNADRAIDQRLRIGVERQFLENDFALRIGSDGGVLTLGFGIKFFDDFKLDYSYFNGTIVKEHFVSLRLPF